MLTIMRMLIGWLQPSGSERLVVHLHGTNAIRFDVADISLTTKSDDADIAEKHILYSGATLNFTDKRNLGVYGNLADYGADDIFANGNGTSIDLPYSLT